MRFWFLVLIVCSSVESLAQEEKSVMTDSTAILSDSVLIRKGRKIYSVESYAARFNPRKALFYAAILPGAGQIYNKKYWKVPLVYGGFLGLLAVVKFYNDAEIKYSNELYTTISAGLQKSVQGHTVENLRTAVDLARRQRDYFTIITGFFYILQMVDAHVDAHLKEFDINPRLKVKLEPSMQNNYYVGTAYGMAVTFKF
jgi:hypothetical protein